MNAKKNSLEKLNKFGPFGQNMIAPSGPSNIDHLVRILPEIFLCRFESPSPDVTGY